MAGRCHLSTLASEIESVDHDQIAPANAGACLLKIMLTRHRSLQDIVPASWLLAFPLGCISDAIRDCQDLHCQIVFEWSFRMLPDAIAKSCCQGIAILKTKRLPNDSLRCCFNACRKQCERQLHAGAAVKLTAHSSVCVALSNDGSSCAWGFTMT